MLAQIGVGRNPYAVSNRHGIVLSVLGKKSKIIDAEFRVVSGARRGSWVRRDNRSALERDLDEIRPVPGQPWHGSWRRIVGFLLGLAALYLLLRYRDG